MTTTAVDQRERAWLVGRLAGDVQAAVVDGLGQAAESAADDDAARVRAVDAAHAALADINRARLAAGEVPLDHDVEIDVIDTVLDNLYGTGIFAPYLRGEDLEDFVANGPGRVFVRRAGGDGWEPAPPLGVDEAGLIEQVRALAARARTERRFDAASPIVDLRLPDGSRLNAVMDVTATVTVSIRRHRHLDITLDDLVALGTLDKALHGFLAAAVAAELNIVVTGDQASGKTTLTRALLGEVGPRVRLATIEDRLELQLSANPDRFPNVVESETRLANAEGQGEVTMRTLVRAALTQATDRVVVGEVRGDEIIDMLDAMSLGARGSLCTLHTLGSAEAINRICTLCARAPERLPRDVAQQLIRDAVQLIVHLEQLPNGRRVVHSVREVTTYRDSDGLQTNEIFAPDHHGRACPAHPPEARTMARLVAVGFDDTVLFQPAGFWDQP